MTTRRFNNFDIYKLINFPAVMRMLGMLLIIEGSFLLMPVVVCLVYAETDWLPFLATGAGAMLVGMALYCFIHPSSSMMGRREGCVLTSMSWLAFSFVGMVPFMWGSSHLNISEAFFETMSGFTTTGATVIRNVEGCSHGILFWRALIQWIGGLGIVLFTLALIPSFNTSGGVSLFRAESSHGKLASRISATAKRLWLFYGSLTIILIILLWFGPMNLFDSVCHAFTCISTGGYSTSNSSIAAFQSPYTMIVLVVFMFIGGANFSLLLGGWNGHFKDIWRNDVFRVYLYLTLGYTFIVALCMARETDVEHWGDLIVYPLFHVVSAMTSTGYGAGNFESWGMPVITLTMIMMYVGACGGSTTGGAKIDRIVYLTKIFNVELKRTVHPNTVYSVSVNGHHIDAAEGNRVIAFMMIYTLMIGVGGVLLSAFGFPIVDSFFAAFSCISNNGLGAGVTGVAGSFDFLPAIGMWVMSFLMLVGRLEVFTIIAMFSPGFWKR